MRRKVLTVIIVSAVVAFASAWPPGSLAQDQTLPSKSDSSCLKCHADYATKPNLLAGKLYDVSSKANTIQLQIDKDMEIIYFDDSTVLKNAPAFKDIPKQESIRINYVKKDGKNLATLIEVKKGLDVPKDQLADVEEVAKLVAMGPEKGKYVLLDSRPENMYNEGHIPTALPMPFFAFDNLAPKLLTDKDVLQIYYCAGFS